MPTLYILEATQVVKRKPSTKNKADNANCHAGTPKGIRIIIAIGEVNGIIDSHTDNELSGLLITKFIEITKVKISGRVMGSMNCCVSVSLSTADPTSANTALYSIYPNRK